MQLSDLLLATAASTGCIAFAQLFMVAYKAEKFRRAFWLKGGAALCFVILGMLLSPFSPNPGYARLVVIGLALGLCGDQLLALRFLVPRLHDLMFAAGAGAFGVGHFFYMKALYDLGSIRLLVLLPIFVIGVAIANLYGKEHGSNAGPLQPAGLAYMVLVIFMGAVSISTFLGAPGIGLALFAIGGICFGVSDNILFAYCFGKQPKWRMNVWVHITYYAAQLLIAWSIFLL
jgi:uncharacterized membrane protein YhhN